MFSKKLFQDQGGRGGVDVAKQVGAGNALEFKAFRDRSQLFAK